MTAAQQNNDKISPFSGRPHTELGYEETGVPFFEVTPREQTPDSAKWAESLGTASAFAVFGFSVYALILTEPDPWVWIAGLVLPWMMAPLFKKWYAWKLSRVTRVVFTPTEFRVLTKGGWDIFDRTLTHRFVMLRHDLTRAEAEQRELQMRRAQQRGRIVNPQRYYGESYHIVFEYMGHRYDVLDVYGKPRATAALARFKACDDVMNNAAHMGGGEVLNPGEQWGEQPGGLPS
jgi:hypothetical protein